MDDKNGVFSGLAQANDQYGQPAPGLRTLFEWYFCGALEKAYEQENGEKPTCEWDQNL